MGLAAGLWVVTIATVLSQGRSFPGTLDQHPAIDYRGAPVTDVVTNLRNEIATGTVTLAFDGRQGFLRSLLERLHVPVGSQVVARMREIITDRDTIEILDATKQDWRE